MRTSIFGKDRRAADFFRLCLGTIVSLTLAMGGMALDTVPVKAVPFDINPPWSFPADNVFECQPFTKDYGFSTIGQSCAVPGDHVYYWKDWAAPDWVTVDMITGAISACPVSGTATASYNFKVWASEVYGDPVAAVCWPQVSTWWSANTYSITLDVWPQAPCIAIVPTLVPAAWEDVPFTVALSVTGGVGPFNWLAAGLPSGLVLDPLTGVVSGAPAPGTCGPWTVMVTCTDTGMCPGTGCCTPITAPLYLYVDCWANYLGMVTTYTTTTSCDFTVNIGPGLAYGTTNVLIDGNPEATLAGNGTELFTSVPCESHLVVVDQTVQGPDPQTRYACVGSNQKWVSDIDNVAYFDYAPEIYIDTGSDPAGIAQPPGAGFYVAGATFSSSAPSPVQSSSQSGTKYLFRAWSLPDGGTSVGRDLSFTVTGAGKATALYDTYYELILKSDVPPVLERSWEPAGSNAAWNLALQPIPFFNFFGMIGGVYEPTNAQGSHNMTGPYTQEIMWQENWFWPIFWIVVTLLAIAAAIYFILRSRKKQGGDAGTAGGPGALLQPPAPEATTEVKTLPVDTAEKSLPKAATIEPVKVMPALSAKPAAKKALPQAEKKAEPEAEPEAEKKDKPNFCPKCGSLVDEGADFCKKCGKKL